MTEMMRLIGNTARRMGIPDKKRTMGHWELTKEANRQRRAFAKWMREFYKQEQG